MTGETGASKLSGNPVKSMLGKNHDPPSLKPLFLMINLETLPDSYSIKARFPSALNPESTMAEITIIHLLGLAPAGYLAAPDNGA
jgi:hypothetical protein